MVALRYTSQIWNNAKDVLGINDHTETNLREVIVLLNNCFKYKSYDFNHAFILLTTSIYHIWNKRNNRVHSNKELSHHQRWIQIIEDSAIISTKAKKKESFQLRSLFEKRSKTDGSKDIEDLLWNHHRLNSVRHAGCCSSSISQKPSSSKAAASPCPLNLRKNNGNSDLRFPEGRSDFISQNPSSSKAAASPFSLSHQKFCNSSDLPHLVDRSELSDNSNRTHDSIDIPRHKLNDCLSYWEGGESSKARD